MDLEKRLTDTLDHLVCMGKDGYGDKTYADPVNYKCLKEGKVRLVKGREGDSIKSTMTFYIVHEVSVSFDDEITFLGTTYPVAAFENFKGFKPGMDLTVVYV
jgi:hypothetical protein